MRFLDEPTAGGRLLTDKFLDHVQDFKGSVPGYKVNTIDTTGAGDAFVGSLLVNVAKDHSIFHV